MAEHRSVCYVHLEKEAWSLMDAGREAPSLNQLCIFFEELTVDHYPATGYLLLELLSDANSGWCNNHLLIVLPIGPGGREQDKNSDGQQSLTALSSLRPRGGE